MDTFIKVSKFAICKGLIIAAPFVFALAGQAQAGFLGQTMTPTYEYPTLGTVYPASSWSPTVFTVGAGQETIGNIEDVTSLLVDFSDTALTITLQTILNGPVWNAVAFNGPVFTSAGLLGITGASVDPATTMAGFDNSRVLFTSNQIEINWNGLGYTSGTAVVIDFTFSPTSVAEPASLSVLGLALAGLIASRRGQSARV